MTQKTLTPHLVAALRDTPYTFIETLNPSEIILAYGDIRERWRLASLPCVAQSRLMIRVRGKVYRFAGQLPTGHEWIVRCRVSGGITGTREAPLKRNGEIQYFATEAEARAEAERLLQKMNHSRSVACFQYWPERA